MSVRVLQVTGNLLRLVVTGNFLTMVIYYLRIWHLLNKTLRVVGEEHAHRSNSQPQQHCTQDTTLTKSKLPQMDDGVFQQLDKGRRALEKRYTNSSLLITGVFLLAWIPITVVLVLRQIQPSNKNFVHAVAWASSVVYSSGAVNPFIYALRHQDIQEKLKQFKRKRTNHVS